VMRRFREDGDAGYGSAPRQRRGYHAGMPTLLFVCTGNLCRSPMAATVARNVLAGKAEAVDVISAGLLRPGQPATDEAVKVMGRRGLDLSTHRSRRVGDALVPAPDLIVGMAREHARAVVDVIPGLFPRTFTLKDFVARALSVGPRRAGETLDIYLARVGTDRGFGALVGSSSADDVADPIGCDLRTYERCAAEIEAAVTSLIDLVWPDTVS
jgi:protein-tyrosine phosphatase